MSYVKKTWAEHDWFTNQDANAMSEAIENNQNDIAGIKNGSNINNFSGVEGALANKQNKIDSANKLSSGLINDTDSNNKFVSPEEKAQITTNKENIATNAEAITKNAEDIAKNAEDILDINQEIDGIKNGVTINSFGAVEGALANKENVENKTDVINENSTNTQYPGARVVYDKLEERVPKTTEVNGHPLSGNVTITKSDVGLGNVDNTSDLNKPVSTAQQLAIDAVQTDITNHKNNTNNPHNVTKVQLGLGNVDNTSDIDKPISTATQSALDLKADKETTYTKTEVNAIINGLFTITNGEWDD